LKQGPGATGRTGIERLPSLDPSTYDFLPTTPRALGTPMSYGALPAKTNSPLMTSGSREIIFFVASIRDSSASDGCGSRAAFCTLLLCRAARRGVWERLGWPV
jgi:hypothetical protein